MLLASAKDFKEINNRTLLTNETTWESIVKNVMKGYTVYHRYYKSELYGEPLSRFTKELHEGILRFIPEPKKRALLKTYSIDSGEMYDKLANYELENDNFHSHGGDDYFYVVFTNEFASNSDALFLLKKD